MCLAEEEHGPGDRLDVGITVVDPVHNRPDSGLCCCGIQHQDDTPELGTPLDPESYNYEAAVLWNAHAGALWRRVSIYPRREIAKRAGLTQRELRHHARESFAKANFTPLRVGKATAQRT